jgi:hypothetical protein
MRIRRTHVFFLLWAVVAILWVWAGSYVVRNDERIPSWTHSCEELRQIIIRGERFGDAEVNRCKALWPARRLELAGWVFGPPIALLVLGTLFGWMVRRRATGKSN